MEKQFHKVEVLYKEDFDCQSNPLLSGKLFREKMADQYGISVEEYEQKCNIGFENDE